MILELEFAFRFQIADHLLHSSDVLFLTPLLDIQQFYQHQMCHVSCVMCHVTSDVSCNMSLCSRVSRNINILFTLNI